MKPDYSARRRSTMTIAEAPTPDAAPDGGVDPVKALKAIRSFLPNSIVMTGPCTDSALRAARDAPVPSLEYRPA